MLPIIPGHHRLSKTSIGSPDIHDDQIVPIDDSARIFSTLLPQGVLKVYPGFPHGMATTHADVINADLLAFIRG